MISATTMEIGEAQQVNIVFTHSGRTLSLTVDNSAGRASSMRRADLRLLVGSDDVTSQHFGGGEDDIVRGTIENMDSAMKWLRSTDWGMKS
jgi:hypothetical protein